MAARRFPHGRAVALFGGRVIFFDPFNRADSITSLGGDWTALTGTWGIDSGKAWLVQATSESVAVVDVGVPDVDISCDLTITGTGAVVCRCIDADNRLYVAVSGTINAIQIVKRDGGANTTLKSVTDAGIVAGTYAVRVVASGARVDAYLAGVLKASYTLTGADLTKFGTPTKVGMRTNAGTGERWDNYRVVAA